ncbi:DUF1572 family protein [Flavihumibacter stibioxidans]|uniref:DUF1572 domain-containing protein n=1 Tax=Flavihumibacter stibioxidans TaxID=1834163 RepID=A0ABR7MBL3_9BACT|nr:DUF1572 family protein [Flavihumibacter stibioxidans]MBC6492433.1 hypothetical protein [Flavihumibacter stibioxidans]
MSLGQKYLSSIRKHFRAYKDLGDRTLAQLNTEQLNICPAEGSNSITIIIRHMHGNMLSRFTNFLTEDGEKSWRQRDQEFEPPDGWHPTGEEIRLLWEEGWGCLLETIDKLEEADLGKTVMIRQEPHFVPDAINRQLAHHASHVGQIVYIGKMLLGKTWNSLSIPIGGSAQFNQDMERKQPGSSG